MIYWNGRLIRWCPGYYGAYVQILTPDGRFLTHTVEINGKHGNWVAKYLWEDPPCRQGVARTLRAAMDEFLRGLPG